MSFYTLAKLEREKLNPQTITATKLKKVLLTYVLDILNSPRIQY